MIGCTKLQLGSLYPKKLFLEIDGKSWIIIINNRMRNSMEFEDINHKNLSCCRCYERVLKRQRMIIFGETTMMNDLFLYLYNPTMKSIEISIQIVGGIESGWSVLGVLKAPPLFTWHISHSYTKVWNSCFIES
jgi:hypothetical protein